MHIYIMHTCKVLLCIPVSRVYSYTCLLYIMRVLYVFILVWSGHPRLVSLICTSENTRVSYYI